MVDREKLATVADALRGAGRDVAGRAGCDGVLANHHPGHADGRVRVAGVGGRSQEESVEIAR